MPAFAGVVGGVSSVDVVVVNRGAIKDQGGSGPFRDSHTARVCL